MEKTKLVEQIKSVLKTLPISYYCGRELQVELDESADTSFIDIMNDTITVSAKNVSSVLNALAEQGTEIDDETFDKAVRCPLYHEVSHAILTPRSISANYHCPNDHEIVNIFEDQRIETILKSYYRNVDFPWMVKLVNGEIEETTALQRFFNIVRFGKGKEEFVRRRDHIIAEFGLDELNFSNDIGESPCCYSTAYYYVCKIRDLWDDIRRDFDEEQKQNEQNAESNTDPSANGEDSKNSTGNGNGNDSQNTDHGENSDGENGESSAENAESKNPSTANNGSARDTSKEEQEREHDGWSETENNTETSECEKLRQSIRNKLIEVSQSIDEKLIDTRFTAELSQIFDSVSKVHRANASAVSAYSGVFDPRAVARRKDYKYFVHQNRAGNARGFSKVHLNLFLDESGSFYNNERLANQIIRSLVDIERKNENFSFTLITMGEGETIREQNDVLYKAYGGNCLDEHVFDIFNKVQSKTDININVVLFDGDAFPEYIDGRHTTFTAFNHDNVLLISDPDNKKYIVNDCPLAKVHITHDYIAELKRLLTNSLRGFVR